MRVVWFVSTEFPAVTRRLGVRGRGGGCWMVVMAREFAKVSDVKLCVVALRDYLERDIAFSEDGIDYRVVGPRGLLGRASARMRCFGSIRKALNALREFSAWSVRADLAECRKIVEEYDAELVTVWGSERAYGLVSQQLAVPVLLWLQGLTGPYRIGFWGTLSFVNRLIWLCKPSNLRLYLSFWRSGSRERDILGANSHFIGRTAWDRSWLDAIRPGGLYYHCNDPLQPEFLEGALWSRETCVPFSIYTTTDSSLRKGTDLLIEALREIATSHGSTRLRIAGIAPNSPRGKQLHRMAVRLGVADRCEFLGYLEPVEMVRELQRAHVFVMTSFIENACNALGEAQAVGTPCVASFAGGTSSLVKDGESGLLYPAGDWACLAGSVKKLFVDDDLALRLSRHATRVARCRHNPRTVANRFLEIYGEVLRSSGCQHKD